MNEDKNANPMEGVEKAQQAASKIKGAVKTGQAISQIAAGTAAAGPYGTVAMFVWENKNTIAKAFVSLFAVCMFLFIFLASLPSIIFNGFFHGEQENAFEHGVITRNITRAEEIVRGRINDSHSSIIAEINGKILRLPNGAEGVIVDVGAGSVYYNTAMVLSMYTASNDEVRNINLWDLRRVMYESRKDLYSYTETITTEIRLKEIPPPNPQGAFDPDAALTCPLPLEPEQKLVEIS